MNRTPFPVRVLALLRWALLITGGLVVITLGAAVSALWLLLTELNSPDPTAALTALLGSVAGAIGVALSTLVTAFAAFIAAIVALRFVTGSDASTDDSDTP